MVVVTGATFSYAPFLLYTTGHEYGVYVICKQVSALWVGFAVVLTKNTRMNDILLIDKPAGWTSFDVCAKIRGAYRKKLRQLHETRGFCTEQQRAEAAKRANQHATIGFEQNRAVPSAGEQVWRCRCRARVGHAGTLDPFATGLLIILLGGATKQAGEFLKYDKVYEATIRLGATSTTGDPEGQLTPVSDAQPTYQAVVEAFKAFTGDITQTPPAFSAIKIGGKRAYQLARQGKSVDIPERQVTIYSLELCDYAYPDVRVRARVSSGTYIRSLAEDIGNYLSTAAYCSELRRTRIGDFSVSDATTPTEVDIDKRN